VVETVLLTLLVFLAVRASFQNFRVQGHSMYPTLEDGQLVVVSPLLYSRIDTGRMDGFIPFLSLGEGKRDIFQTPARGDIIIFHGLGPRSSDLIKRVIGLPGDQVQIIEGVVYIDDRRLDEPYITDLWDFNMPRTFLPPDYYFVMGDNRNNSEDSRSERVGLVHRDQIIGKALFSWWPRDRLGLPSQAPGQLTDEPPPRANSPAPAAAPGAPASR
jgi:signal peptidase I